MCHFLRSSRLTRAAAQTDLAPLRSGGGLQRWASYLDRMPADFVDALSGRDDHMRDVNENVRPASSDLSAARQDPR
jgi:hypothetical protein